ncbi:MAG TPA: hydroxymethylbilane synthase [Aquifex aeolicus]|uniref:Porphobilinogen deaminase n=1 Tax=Aquifex aeolicus TaxID=63363 RepID=A0A7C5Q8D0_AQUAO|nr:hydroxymethylbilane synthase [Aquifex aeolicus]
MKVRIGTRKSKLALWQANFIGKLLEERWGVEVELVKITTTGDRILDAPLAKIGGKGLFVKEIEQALLEGRIDLAVHSLKDVPMVIPEGLTLSAITKREDPHDVLISRNGKKLRELPEGAKVGTSSLRRQVQIRRVRPDLRVEVLRGNVDTRMRKLREGLYDAVILALAGVRRMGYEGEVTEILRDFIPAVGQGSLAIETREDDEKIRELVEPLDHRESRFSAECERAFLRKLEGGCQVPIGAYAEVKGERIVLRGFVSDLEGRKFIEGSEEGRVQEAAEVGERLAEELLSRGGREVLKEIYGG